MRKVKGITLLVAMTAAAAALADVALTPEYLEGDWCYAYLQMKQNPPDEMNVNYNFNQDGSF